jgi:hypothetical protein
MKKLSYYLVVAVAGSVFLFVIGCDTVTDSSKEITNIVGVQYDGTGGEECGDVTLCCVDNFDYPHGSVSAITDADGAFLFEEVPWSVVYLAGDGRDFFGSEYDIDALFNIFCFETKHGVYPLNVNLDIHTDWTGTTVRNDANVLLVPSAILPGGGNLPAEEEFEYPTLTYSVMWEVGALNSQDYVETHVRYAGDDYELGRFVESTMERTQPFTNYYDINPYDNPYFEYQEGENTFDFFARVFDYEGQLIAETAPVTVTIPESE